MTGFKDFHFALPEALLGFFGLPFLAALFWAAEKHRIAALNAFISARLQSRLAGTVSPARRRWSLICLVASLSLALLALAQPRWGFTWEERTSKGRDIILAIDTSRSMLAQDLKPSRMVRARMAAHDLLATLDGDRVGLIAFAGTAFLQAPLTADYDAVRNALGEIDAEIIPRGGTNLTAAIQNAEDAFGKGESEHRALIIFTDGEELEADAVDAAKAARDTFRIFTVGLGSPEGGLIPLENERGGTDFVRDEQGQYVTSRLDEARLREIAETAGGFYVHLQGGPAEMQQIVREGLGKMKERDSDSRFTKQPIERYQWPLAGAVVFAISALLIGERRRELRKAAATTVAGLLFLLAAPAQAAPEVDFNRGCDAFKAGDYSAAAHAFSVALGTGEAPLQAKAAYNLANTLARRGTQLEKKEEKIAEWKNAIQHYDRALSLEANYADAKHNRDLVEKAIADLEKEQKEEQKQDQQDKQEKKDDEKKEEKKDDGKEDQKSGQDEKEQQQKSGDKKNEKGEKEEKEQQQKSGDSGDEKKEQSKKEGADSKEGKKEDQPQSQQNDEKKPGESQEGEKKDGEQKEQPAPDPAQNQPPKEGELKAGNPQPPGAAGEPSKDDAAEEAAAAAAGRMTDKQAKALLESIKDARPRLLDPRDVERRPKRGFKDW